MTEPDWLALLITVLGGGLLANGLLTGRMPADIISAEPEQAKQPLGFWVLGTLYACITIGKLWLFIRSLM